MGPHQKGGGPGCYLDDGAHDGQGEDPAWVGGRPSIHVVTGCGDRADSAISRYFPQGTWILTSLQTRLLLLKVFWSHDLQEGVEEGHVRQLTDQDQGLLGTESPRSEAQSRQVPAPFIRGKPKIIMILRIIVAVHI